MADIVKHLLARPIQLADQILKIADEASSVKQECLELKSKTEKLSTLLRQAARASNDLYERPTRRIVYDTEQVLDKALSLVLKCRGSHGLVKRVFTIIPVSAFRKMSAQLENSIGDVSWLLRVSASAEDRDDEGLGLPPIAANEPILGIIWEQIAILGNGSVADRSDAAGSLVSLARGNHRFGKLIIEEGGVGPLLKLLKEGSLEGQENAARAIGQLGRDAESVEQMVHAGVCQVFAKILKEGSMKVQAVVAWAVSELAANYPKCQDLFTQHNIIRLIVSHLAFETVPEHSKYSVVTNKTNSIHSIALASSSNFGAKNSRENEDARQSPIVHPFGDNRQNCKWHNVVSSTVALNAQLKLAQGLSNGTDTENSMSNNNRKQNHVNHHPTQSISLSGNSSISKERELEEPATKAYMKAMAARALGALAKGNSPICRSITESRALLCFAVLLEKGSEDVQYNCAMALMEITAVAEDDTDLRKSAFKPNSPACKAAVDQLLKVIEKGDSELLVPCIKAIGNLARTFRATETRVISPLVLLLDEREAMVTREACIALAKFACTHNYLHQDHSKAILNAGGAKHLVQLVYFGEQIVQSSALILLGHISLHVPDDEELAKAEVLTVLEWASKQASLTQDENVTGLLEEAKGRLELYQSRGSRGYH